VTLIFEDELTVRYQVQEMLRVERIFEEEGIQDELDAYNPLIPDGRNLKATMMIEYEDEAERRAALAKLKGVEDKTWVRVEAATVYAIADEDLERETEEKTSSVHFLRFELTAEMAAAMKYGVTVAIGIDHPHYSAALDPIPRRCARRSPPISPDQSRATSGPAFSPNHALEKPRAWLVPPSRHPFSCRSRPAPPAPSRCCAPARASRGRPSPHRRGVPGAGARSRAPGAPGNPSSAAPCTRACPR
jgi:hypothetical protein